MRIENYFSIFNAHSEWMFSLKNILYSKTSEIYDTSNVPIFF
ncbi:Uncharacterized protein dnm_092430 [Desulfonema magnum]|uniref:Uncharacterized protein n=1 Tax=Desulfonema magnum TaxID=45655 RepID=A0A975GTJ4_9BACT|nr:Uncharacterized protein dnm_092430 [Desulfonema magnum]